MQTSRAPAISVSAESCIPAGLRLGPVPGIFKLGKYLSDRREPGPKKKVRMVRGELVDEAGSSALEWIGLIRAARNAQEQTLEAISDLPGGQIFYRALRDVQPGEELTVWYSNPLAQWFDIPVTATPTHDEKGTANTVEKMYASREDIGFDFGDDSKVGSKPIKPNPNIDGGWAWMIVLSSFLVHILIMGSQMALGILNMEWLEEFNQSRGLTAWVSSLSMGITLIVGPFIGLFITMCGCRKTAIIGGILNALGWILSAYASNVHYLFLTFGVTAGVGSGMVYLPAVVMVGQYFQKRRALAQGLSTTGTGFGAFLMTALLKYLCREFGWRNAMFIQGAISLNLCVCGALMRPLSHKDVNEKYVVRRNSENNQAKALSHSAETLKSNGVINEETDKKEEATNEEVLDSVKHIETEGKSRSGKSMYGLLVLKTASQLTVTVRKGFGIWYSSYFGAASLFTNRVFVAFIIWALFAYSSFVIPFIHLPEIVKQYNLSSQNNIFPLTSIIAIVHIFGKVILGIISDLPCISTWNVFLMANVTLVTCILTLPLMQTYISLAVICALIGFSSGYFSLMPVVTEDLVGTKHLANAYGIIICANGISALLGPPFAGWIYDITHKYDFSFYICGLLYLVGILFLFIQPYIGKKQPQEKSTEEEQV